MCPSLRLAIVETRSSQASWLQKRQAIEAGANA
jgi:hypothetical protein